MASNFGEENISSMAACTCWIVTAFLVADDLLLDVVAVLIICK